MNALMQLWDGARRHRSTAMQGIAAPLIVVAILSMMVLPLPAWMLDIFFTINLAVAIMVMMVAGHNVTFTRNSFNKWQCFVIKSF